MNRTSASNQPRVLDKRDELIVVGPADNYRIELDAGEIFGGLVDACQHLRQGIEAGERLKAIGSQRVEADSQPMQAGLDAALAPGRRA